jgi:hypothetical protein
MANELQKLMPLVAIGAGLWFLTRRGVAGPAAPPARPTPPDPWGGGATPDGYANVGGTLGNIGLSGREGELGLHAHRVSRAVGEQVQVGIEWTNSTTDFAGNPISWPARVLVELGHSTGWGVGGWDNMRRLLGSGGEATDTQLDAAAGSNASVVELVIGLEPSPPKAWDARVRLEMQGSTSSGHPDGVWSEVSRETHEDAVETVAAIGPSSIGGNIGSIYVNPWGITSGYVPAPPDPWGGRGSPDGFQNTPAARMNMRRLGLSQQRSPWGTVGQPETLNWPVSNRNPNLPGVGIIVRQTRGTGMGAVGHSVGPGHRMYAV